MKKKKITEWLLEDDCSMIDIFIKNWNADENNKLKFPTKPKEAS